MKWTSNLKWKDYWLNEEWTKKKRKRKWFLRNRIYSSFFLYVLCVILVHSPFFFRFVSYERKKFEEQKCFSLSSYIDDDKWWTNKQTNKKCYNFYTFKNTHFTRQMITVNIYSYWVENVMVVNTKHRAKEEKKWWWDIALSGWLAGWIRQTTKNYTLDDSHLDNFVAKKKKKKITEFSNFANSL